MADNGKKIEPYVKKFYGVLPARVDFLIDVYNLPKEKCELLVMGADDDLVKKNEKPEIRKKFESNTIFQNKIFGNDRR